MASSFVNQRTESMAPDHRRTTLVVALRKIATDEMFALDEPRRRWTIGASSSCDIVLRDSFVSSAHCVIERRPGRALVVRDHKSRNRTFVDGRHVEGAELRVCRYLTVRRTTRAAMASGRNSPPRPHHAVH